MNSSLRLSLGRRCFAIRPNLTVLGVLDRWDAACGPDPVAAAEVSRIRHGAHGGGVPPSAKRDPSPVRSFARGGTWRPLFTLVLIGVAVLTASALDTSQHLQLPGSASGTIARPPAPQTLTWRAPTSEILRLHQPHVLAADSTSGLPVTFRVLSGPGRIDGVSLTLTNAGSVRVVAEQAGNQVFAPAPAVARTFNLSSYSVADVQQWPGMESLFVMSVAVAGNFAYVGSSASDGTSRLAVVDVADLARPRLITQIKTRAAPMRVIIAGSRAYLVARGIGVEAVDVSDPANPVAGDLLSVAFATGVHVEGQRVYVSGGEAGLVIFDHAVPGQPRELGRLQLAPNQSVVANAVTVSGGYAYLAVRIGAEPGLAVVDVSDPTRPSVVATHRTLNGVTDVVVREDFAYLAVSGGLFQVVDVTQPTVPKLVSELSYGGQEAVLEVAGSTAFVFTAPMGMGAIDVSDPQQPRLLGVHALPRGAVDAVVIGGHAFVADWAALQIVDVQDPSRMQPVGDWLAGITVEDVEPVGTRLMVAGGAAGLIVLEPRSSGGFERVGLVPFAWARWIDVEGDRGYVWNSPSPTHELVVLDLTRAAAPVVLGRCPMPIRPYVGQVLQGLAYSVEGPDLVIRDVRDPSAMAVVSQLPIIPADQVASLLRVTQGLVFVAVPRGNAFLVDVRDPARPATLGKVPVDPELMDAAFVGGRLVTSSTQVGLQVWDVADPRGLRLVGSVPASAFAPAWPTDFIAVGDVLWVRLNRGAVVPIDCSNPSQPIPRPSLALPVGGLRSSTKDNLLLVSGTQGLRVVRLRQGIAQTLEFSPPKEWVAAQSLLLTPTSSSGLPVKLSVLSGPATVEGGRLIPTGIGDVLVLAEQPGDELWLSASAERKIWILMAQQWITWREPEGLTVLPGQTHALLAEASSGLPVTFQVESGPGVITDRTLTATGPGRIRVVAEQAGNALFRATTRTQTYNPESGDLSWLGAWTPEGVAPAGGGCHAVHADGPLAAVLVGGDLQVLDIAQPAQPRALGRVRLRVKGEDVVVAGAFAYVAMGSGGFDVLHLRNPAAITRASSTVSASATQLTLVGSRLYVDGGSEGVTVFETVPPAPPRPIVSWGPSRSAAREVLIQGDYAYVASGTGLEIRDAAQGGLLGRFDGIAAEGVRVAADYAFIAAGAQGLQVADISFPASPRLVGGIDTAGFARRVQMRGLHALLADGIGGLAVVDVSTLVAPQLKGVLPTAGEVVDLHTAGSTVLVADRTEGLRILTLTADGRSPQRMTWNLPESVPAYARPLRLTATASSGLPVSFALVEGPAILTGNQLVVTGRGRVVVRAEQSGDASWMPVTQQATLEVTGVRQEIIWVSPSADRVAVGASASLVTFASSGLPVSYRVESGPARIENDRLIVTDAGVIRVVASQPGNARYEKVEAIRTFSTGVAGNREMGTWTNGYAYKVVVEGGTAYLASVVGSSLGLSVLDVRDPAHPRFLGRTNTLTSSATAMAVENGVAYVAGNDDNWQGKVTAIDCRDPSRPIRLGTLNHTPGELAVASGYVYVADYSGEVAVLDFTDPQQPRHAGTLVGGTDRAMGLDVEGLRLAVAGGAGGFQLYDLTDPAYPQRSASLALGNIVGVALQGAYAFASRDCCELVVMDVSDASAPRVLNQVPVRGSGRVLARGTSLWITRSSDDPSSVSWVDIRIPTEPVVLGELPLGQGVVGQVLGLDVWGDRLFVAGYPAGLRILEPRLGLPQSLVLDVPDSIVLTNAGVTVKASASSGLPVRISLLAGPGTLYGDVLTAQEPGSLQLRFEQSGDARWQSVVEVRSIQVVRAPQQIAWTATTPRFIAVGSTQPVVAAASSGLPVTLGLISGPARLDGRTLSVAGPGLIRLQATQEGNNRYEYAVAELRLNETDVVVDWTHHREGTSRVGEYSPGSPYVSVLTHGSYTYVVNEQGDLLVFDTRREGSPVFVGEHASLFVEGAQTEHRFDMAAYGARLAVSAVGKLWTLDLGEPARPRVVSGYRAPSWCGCHRGFRGLAISGPSLFAVATYIDSVLQFDLDSPNLDPLLPAMPVTQWGMQRIAASGSTVCGVDYSRLAVLDFSDPLRPRLAGSLSFLDPLQDVSLEDGIAVVLGTDDIFAVDLHNPSAPRVVGIASTAGRPLALDYSHGFAAVAEGANGIEIFDLRVPESPARLGAYSTPGIATDVQWAGYRLMVADGPGGLVELDVRSPGTPRPLALGVGPRRTGEVRVAGDVAVVADGPAGWMLVDLGTPGEAPVVARSDSGVEALGVDVQQDRAYIASGTQGVIVLNVSDPRHPRELARVALGDARDVAAAGSLVAVATRDGLVLLDLADPFVPKTLGRLPTPNPVTRLVLHGTRIALEMGEDRPDLWLVDVANPAAPRQIWAHYGLLSSADQSFDLHGSRLALIADGKTVEIYPFDAGGRVGPVVTVEAAGEVSAVTLSESFLYLGLPWGAVESQTPETSGVQVFDLNVPGLASPMGVFPTARSVRQVLVDDRRIGVVFTGNGLALGTLRAGRPQGLHFVLPAIALPTGAPLALQASAESGLPVQYRVVSGPATLSGNLLSPTGPGVITVRASQDGDDIWLPGAAEATIEFRFVEQAISWVAPAEDTIWPGTTVRLEARSSQALPVSFGLLCGPAVLAGDRLTVTNWGAVQIVAVQSGTPVVAGSTAARTFNAVTVQLTRTGQWPGIPGAEVQQLAVVGDRVHLGAGKLGLVTVDLDSDGNPRFTGGDAGAGWVRNLGVHGGAVYAGSEDRLTVYDATGPPWLQWVDTIEGLGGPFAMNDRLALFTRGPSVEVFALESAFEWTPRSVLDLEGGWPSVVEVALHGNLACVLTFERGLYVFDAGDATQPRLLGRYDPPGGTSFSGLALVGHHALLVAPGAGVITVDLSDPTRPRHVSTLPIRDRSLSRLVVEGDLGWLAAGEAGVIALDVTRPEYPFVVGRFDTDGQALAVRTIGHHVFVADGSMGLQILEARLELPPTLTGLVDEWLRLLEPALPGNARGLWSDPDHDGAPNAIEFLLGQSALVASPEHGRLPVGRIETVGDRLCWVVEFDLNPRLPAGLPVEVEATTGVGTDAWMPVPRAALRRDGARVTVTLPADGEARFLRLIAPLIP